MWSDNRFVCVGSCVVLCNLANVYMHADGAVMQHQFGVVVAKWKGMII